MASRSTNGIAARWRSPRPLLAVVLSAALAAAALGTIASPAAAAGHARQARAATSADDGSWQPEDLPAGIAVLTAVTCPVADTCVAVGEASGGGGVALETTDGGSLWSQLSIPSDAGELLAVSCVSENVCLAGGSANAGGGIVLEQQTLGGGFVADPAVTSTQLAAMGAVIGISCVLTTSSCALLADQLPQHSDPMFGSTDVGDSSESWKGPFYLPETMGSNGDFLGLYSGVDCLAGGACYVAGETDTSGGSEIMAWSDDYWTTDAINEAEPGNGAGSEPQDLSCGTSASLTECLVVGSVGGSGEDALFSCSTSGGIGCFWGNPAATPTSYLPSAAYCLPSFTSGASLTCAAAASTTSGGGSAPHGIWGTGDAASAWTPEATPADAGYLGQINCSPSNFCVAVGKYTTGGGMLLVADDDLLTETAGPPGGAIAAPHMVGGACGCAAGEPVNVATGDFYETDTDVSVPTYGPALTFQRTYDASSAQAEESVSTPGPLGYGWTFDYAEHLVVGSDEVTVIGAKGDATEFYAPTTVGGAPGCPAPYETDPSPSFAAGSYCAASYDDESLTYDATSGTYTLVSRPGGAAVFDGAGQLTTLYDTTAPVTASGVADTPALTITYNSPAPGVGHCPKAARSCELVTSASGRTVTVTWSQQDDGGLVTSVVDPAGRTTTFGYCAAPSATCTTGDLVSVTDPMGDTTSYTYTDSSGTPVEYQSDLATITPPDGQSTGADLQNVYDSSGRVTSQTDPDHAVTGWDYSGMNETSGTGSVVVTDPTGVATTYDFVGFEFTGSETAGQPATTEAVNWSSLTPIGSTDADGATTAETTDAAGDVTSVRNALGETTSAWYNSDNESICTASASADVESDVPASDYVPGNACESLFRAGLLPGSAAPPVEGSAVPPVSNYGAPPAYVTYDLYDDLGNLLWSETGGVFVQGDSVGDPTGVSASYHLYAGDTLTIGTAKATCTAAPPSPVLACATIAPADSRSATLRITRLAYDAAGDLSSSSVLGATGTGASTTTYRHDADGELTATVSPLGNATGSPAPDAALYTASTTYDADGRPTEVQSGLPGTVFGREELFSYDAGGNETSTTNSLFETTTTAYDADNRPTFSTNPDGESTLTCHDGDGRVFETVPPAGVSAAGLSASSCPAPPANGQTVSGQPSDATITQYSVGAEGETVSQTVPPPAGQSSGTVTTSLYDPAGLLAAVLSPTAALPSGEEAATAYSYDAAHRRIAVSSGLAYDPSASSYTTTAATTTSSTCYDSGGAVSGTVPGDGNTSATVTAAGGLPVVSGFVCGPGRAAGSPDETTYGFDALGDMVTTARPVTSAASATTTDSYFPDGSLDTSQSPQGLTTTDSYTAAGWLAGESYSGTGAGGLAPESFSYDAAGEQTSATDASGTSTQLFNPFGKLASATDGDGATVSYGYDDAGDVAAISYPLGSSETWAQSDTVEYGRDKAGLVTSLTDFSGHKVTVAHDADGATTAENLPTTAPVTVSTCYATTAGVASDGLAAISLEPTADAPVSCSSTADWTDGFTYSDTAAGLVSSESDTPTSSCSPVAYGYNAADRLSSYAPGSCSGESPGFDASGNLTSLPGGATAAYQPGGELCWSATSPATGCSSTPSGAVTYTYDGDGDLAGISSPQESLGWNGEDQLTSFAQGSVDMTAATYDASGLRTSDTFSGTTQQFSWDRVSENVPRLLTDGTNAYLYLDGETPVEQLALASGARSYLLADAIGSVRAVIDFAGAVVAKTAYDPWGNPTTSLAAETPFAFAGGYQDPSGFEYLLSRYYDPSLGQFLSVDPLVDETLQPYGYVDGDPVNATDPSGQCGCAAILGEGAGGVSLTFGVLSVGAAVNGELNVAGFAGAFSFAVGILALGLDAKSCSEGDEVGCAATAFDGLSALTGLASLSIAFFDPVGALAGLGLAFGAVSASVALAGLAASLAVSTYECAQSH